MAATQTPAGIPSFDVPEMLKPLAQSISDIQERVNETREQIVADMNRDPVPQFTDEQIQEATQFLKAAMDAMQTFIENFKSAALKDMDEETIKMFQEKTRESARQLVLLFGDGKSEFNGSNMKGELVGFQEASQSAEIRKRLESLESFLNTFGQTKWLGQMTSHEDFQKIQLVIAILQGLLKPSKANLPTSLDAAAEKLDKVKTEVAGLQKHKMQHSRNYQHWQMHQQWQGSFEQFYGKRWSKSDDEYLEKLIKQQDELQNLVCSFANDNNPLKQILESTMPLRADKSSASLMLKCLSTVCAKLSQIFEEDERKRVEMQDRLRKKMDTLKVFAVVLNRMPEVLNRYVLVRLGDIDVSDLSMLKGWISHEEATSVHKMLEAFRDEAIYERAIRELSARTHSFSQCPGSESVASAKEYLFVNSVGQACKTSDDGLDGEEEDEQEEDTPDQANTPENIGARRKPSHRQRKRRANFFASIPRTPSSGTHQG